MCCNKGKGARKPACHNAARTSPCQSRTRPPRPSSTVNLSPAPAPAPPPFDDLPPSYAHAAAESSSSAPAYSLATPQTGNPDTIPFSHLALADSRDPNPETLLSRALAWTQTQQPSPSQPSGSRAGGLKRMIAIPSTDHSSTNIPSTSNNSSSIAFAPAYAASLHAHGIDADTFAAFLNGAAAAGTVQSHGQTSTTPLALKQLETYLHRANTLFFHPRGLSARVLGTEALFDALRVSGSGRESVLRAMDGAGASARGRGETLGVLGVEALVWGGDGFGGLGGAEREMGDGRGGEGGKEKEKGAYEDALSVSESDSSSDTDSDTSSDADSIAAYREYLDRRNSIDGNAAGAVAKGERTPSDVARSRDNALEVAEQSLKERLDSGYERKREKRQRKAEWRAMKRERRQLKRQANQERWGLPKGERKAMKREAKSERKEAKREAKSARRGEKSERKAGKWEAKGERKEGKMAAREERREDKWERKAENKEVKQEVRRQVFQMLKEKGQAWFAGRGKKDGGEDDGVVDGEAGEMLWLVIEPVQG